MEAEQAKKWAAQWRAPATVLEEFRVEKLSRLDETQNAAIAMAFHPLGETPLVPAMTSGLVEQQRIFMKAREVHPKNLNGILQEETESTEGEAVTTKKQNFLVHPVVSLTFLLNC